MCKTTQATKVASDAVAKAVDMKKPLALPPIQSLQKFLSDAYNAEKANLENVPNVISGSTLVTKQLAISIRAIWKDEGGSFGNYYAEIPQNPVVDPMCYSGSLVKVAAVYAAFDLRAAARIHAKGSLFTNQNAFFSSLAGVIDTSAAIPRLKTFGRGLTPALKDIFVFDNTSPNKVEFIKKFKDALANIFHNESATICIDALGYSYINVSLMNAHFFDPTSLIGIWLAGDYSRETSLKSVRVPCVNDSVPGGGAQVITTKEMTRMFFLLHTKQAYSHITDIAERNASNEEAHNIIKSQVSWFENTTPGVTITEPIPFTVDCTKVGIGSLGPVDNPGAPVYSEAEILAWTNNTQIAAFNNKFNRKLTGDFAVCWQNLYQLEQHINPLVRMINSTILNFINQ